MDQCKDPSPASLVPSLKGRVPIAQGSTPRVRLECADQCPRAGPTQGGNTPLPYRNTDRTYGHCTLGANNRHKVHPQYGEGGSRAQRAFKGGALRRAQGHDLASTAESSAPARPRVSGFFTPRATMGYSSYLIPLHLPPSP